MGGAWTCHVDGLGPLSERVEIVKFVLVMLAVLMTASPAHANNCATVLSYVNQYGYRASLAWAKVNLSPRQIRNAKACLRRAARRR